MNKKIGMAISMFMLTVFNLSAQSFEQQLMTPFERILDLLTGEVTAIAGGIALAVVFLFLLMGWLRDDLFKKIATVVVSLACLANIPNILSWVGV